MLRASAFSSEGQPVRAKKTRVKEVGMAAGGSSTAASQQKKAGARPAFSSSGGDQLKLSTSQ
jgi:hypothetical protein